MNIEPKALYIKHSGFKFRSGTNWDDPVSVSEYNKKYYEEHKKLKGRMSTKGLNEEGTELASYMREGINYERNQKIQSSLDTKNKNITSAQERTSASIEKKKNATAQKIEQHTAQMTTQIDSLKKRLSAMRPEDRRKHREEFQNEIAKLRNANKAMKEELKNKFYSDKYSLTEKFQKKKGSEKNQHAKNTYNAKTEADNRYMNVLDKLKADPKYMQIKKGKGGTSSGKKSSGSGSGYTGYQSKYDRNKYRSSINKYVKSKK